MRASGLQMNMDMDNVMTEKELGRSVNIIEQSIKHYMLRSTAGKSSHSHCKCSKLGLVKFCLYVRIPELTSTYQKLDSHCMNIQR